MAECGQYSRQLVSYKRAGPLSEHIQTIFVLKCRFATHKMATYRMLKAGAGRGNTIDRYWGIVPGLLSRVCCGLEVKRSVGGDSTDSHERHMMAVLFQKISALFRTVSSI